MKKYKAFSLIELLISLIIISLIIAAFAPIMTKRLNRSQLINSSNTKRHEILITPKDLGKDEYYYSCENTLTENSNGKKHLNCTLKNLPESVNAILVGAGGGGGSAEDGGEATLIKEINSLTSTNDRTIKLTPFMKNIKITLLGAGGGGGGAVFYYDVDVKHIAECPPSTVTVSYTNGMGTKLGTYCVTQYNLRPAEYSQYHNNTVSLKFSQDNIIDKEIPVNVSLVSGISTINEGEPACWIAPVPGYSSLSYGYYGTSVSCTLGLSGDYQNCGRTVCNWFAAEKMCQELALGGNTCDDGNGNLTSSCKGRWHLPSAKELTSGGRGIFRDNLSAFFFCNSNSCPGLYGYCLGGFRNANGSDICMPDYIWGDIISLSPFKANYGNISGSGWSSNNSGAYNSPKSVRCSILKNGYYYHAFSGGGGSSGAYAENIEIPYEIFEKCKDSKEGCDIKFTIGKGGNGVSSGKALSGSDTAVEIIDNTNIIWKYSVKGGEGGYSGSSGVIGVGAQALDVTNSCMECIDKNCSIVACSKTGLNGEDGEGYEGTEEKTLSGGYGAKSPLTPSKGDGGVGSRAYKTSSFGALKGMSGQDGYAKITYEGKAQGASGGGGGGGAKAEIKGIVIPSSTQVFIQVGAGGSAGGSFDGKDGGDTTFSTYAAYGGKGGKKGKAETSNTNAQLGQGGEGGKLFPETLQSATKNLSSWGENGKNAQHSDESFCEMGGNGGISGISVLSKITNLALTSSCGGFQNDNCYNAYGGIVTANGSFIEFKKPSKLFTSQPDYGTAGSGGGGGGWKYENNTFIGNAGQGTDGYIYIWW